MPKLTFDYDPWLTPLQGPTDLPCGHWVHIRDGSDREGWDLHTRMWETCQLSHGKDDSVR